jgi:general secretion pathway protein D
VNSLAHCLPIILRALGAAVIFCAGCGIQAKPAPSGSVGPIQLRRHAKEQVKSTTGASQMTGRPATNGQRESEETAGNPPVAVQADVQVSASESRPVAHELEPAKTKPVAVELGADTPSQTRPVVKVPPRVEAPRPVPPPMPMRAVERKRSQPAATPHEEVALATIPVTVEWEPPNRAEPPEPEGNAPTQALGAEHVEGHDTHHAQQPVRNEDEMVSVNFEQVDIRTVLKSIGQLTAINFIPAAGVTGQVTVMSPTPIRLGAVYGFLQSILDVYGYATIETENAVKVIPKTDAVKRNLKVYIGADPAYIPKTDELITQILPLKYADADEILQIIEPFLSTGTTTATYPRTNSIMITDTAANIHYVAQIVQQLDVEGSKEKVVVIPLTYASAQVLSEQINQILERTQAATTSLAAGRIRATAPTDKKAKILPDNRTNALIVVAAEPEIETLRGLVAQLDVERPTGNDNVHVVYLKNADANEVARSLDTALIGMKAGGAVDGTQPIQVTADASTNALIVVASAQDFQVISQIITKLDIVREQVLVEMLILEVTEEALKEIGVDWATMDQAVSNSVRGFGATNLGPRVDFESGTLEGLALGAWKGTGSDIQIGAILQALEKTSGVNILSSSSMVTSNHHEANMVAGESRPFVTGSRITETTDPSAPTVIKQYDYRDVGVTMKITPHVSQAGLIRLNIDGEITKLITAVTSASIDTPVTAKRRAQTTVTMKSDATVVIGGLTRDDTTRVEKKLPLLGDLPLLGGLFRYRSEESQKTNLLIFITPHVMNGQDDWVDVSNKKKDQMPPAYEWKD